MHPLAPFSFGSTRFRQAIQLAAPLVLSSLSFLCGCGGTNLTPGIPFVSISGSSRAAQQPISQATVQVYAMGVDGDGSASVPLLSRPVLTDEQGRFSIVSQVACPAPSSQLYVLVTGGNPGLRAGTSNSAIAEVAALGPCSKVSSTTGLVVDEKTTVATVWSLAGFISNAKAFGSTASGQADLGSAVEAIHAYLSTVAGDASSQEAALQKQKFNSLANMLAACMQSAGGRAGDGSACARLFEMAGSAGAPTDAISAASPTDTISAALAIANHPAQNVDTLFALSLTNTPFQPRLDTSPTDWALALRPMLAAPTASLASGTYTSAQKLAWTHASVGAKIYYTTDGSTPTVKSTLYTGPLTVSSTQLVRAVAAVGDQTSAGALVLINVVPQVSVSITPASSSLSASQTMQFSATVTGASNKGVAWALTPAIGRLSAAGLYTAPATINTPQVITVKAISVADPSKTASATVLLQAQVKVGVSPASATLAASQQVRFTPLVTGSTTSAVTWTLSPAVGSMAADGTYTAPASVGRITTITATASSVDDVSKTASTLITLTPPVIGKTFMGVNVGDTLHRDPSFAFGTLSTNGRVTWGAMNPQRGSYKFEDFDQLVSYAQAKGSEVNIVLTGTPLWASSKPTAESLGGPGSCAPPSNIAYWDEFIAALASHARGIQGISWSVWNEAQNDKYWCSDPATMVTMAQHAWTILKAADPTAKVLSPSIAGFPNPGPQWLAAYLAAGGGNYADAISFHGYSTATAEDVATVVSQVKAVTSAAGYGSLPLWNTEGSWAGDGDRGTPSMLDQVAYIPRYFLLQWSAGVSHVIWYEYDGGEVWGGLEVNFIETPASTAYAETYKWMVGSFLKEPCTASVDKVWSCDLQHGLMLARATWTTGGNKTLVVPAEYVLYRDMSGFEHVITNHQVPVTGTPILLETASLKL